MGIQTTCGFADFLGVHLSSGFRMQPLGSAGRGVSGLRAGEELRRGDQAKHQAPALRLDLPKNSPHPAEGELESGNLIWGGGEFHVHFKPRDPSPQKTTPETEENRIRFLERTMVEKNEESASRNSQTKRGLQMLAAFWILVEFQKGNSSRNG